MTQIDTNRFPRQIKYIIGNEAAERFSYYGMRAILVVFMVQILGMAESESKAIYHYFMLAAYFLPLIGAFVSDRYLGKYKTIIFLSLVYCVGHLVLALFENKAGLIAGLGLIAIGAGGIKPCVSAHVGDQFNDKNKHLIPRVFSLFYIAINVGAAVSSILIPWILPRYGARIAFGIPGILMFLATYIFWLGRHHYVHVPPTGASGPAGFGKIFFEACFIQLKKFFRVPFWESVSDRFSRKEIENAKAVSNIFKVFAAVTVFWALFDQQGSSWTLQATRMNPDFFGFKIEASMLQAANPIMVLILTPLFAWTVYPLAEKWGYIMTPLRKMSIGMLFAGLSFASMGILENLVLSGVSVHILWQTIPYLIITASEVLVSITGLEFAYTQAPKEMKSTVMSFWYLTVAFGNFLAGVVAQTNVFKGASEFYFFAILMAFVAVLFVYQARAFHKKQAVLGS